MHLDRTIRRRGSRIKKGRPRRYTVACGPCPRELQERSTLEETDEGQIQKKVTIQLGGTLRAKNDNAKRCKTVQK
jgi:hypothetical protein